MAYIQKTREGKVFAKTTDQAIKYIARENPGYKQELEGGVVPITGHGILKGKTGKELEELFHRATFPGVNAQGRITRAIQGYNSHVLTLPKELSMYLRDKKPEALQAVNAAIEVALAKVYPGMPVAAVGAMHISNDSEIPEAHFHVHLLVARHYVVDKERNVTRSINSATWYPDKNARDGLKMREHWTKHSQMELESRFKIGIEQDSLGRWAVTKPSGEKIRPLTRASQREMQRQLLSEIASPYPYKNSKTGEIQMKPFELRSIDARILECSSNGSFDFDRFQMCFPKTKNFGTIKERVATLKQYDYLDGQNRPTQRFIDQGTILWDIYPHWKQIRADIMALAVDKNDLAIIQKDPFAKAMENQELKLRMEKMNATPEQLKKVELAWQSNYPEITPEMKRHIEEVRAEEKESKGEPQKIPKTTSKVIDSWHIAQDSIAKPSKEQNAVSREMLAQDRKWLEMAHAKTKKIKDAYHQNIDEAPNWKKKYVKGDLGRELRDLERLESKLALSTKLGTARLQRNYDPAQGKLPKPLKQIIWAAPKSIPGGTIRNALIRLAAGLNKAQAASQRFARMGITESHGELLTATGKTPNPGNAQISELAEALLIISQKRIAIRHSIPKDEVDNLRLAIDALELQNSPLAKTLSQFKGHEDLLLYQLRQQRENPRMPSLERKITIAASKAIYIGRIIQEQYRSGIKLNIPQNYISAGMEGQARNFLMTMRAVNRLQTAKNILEKLTPANFKMLMNGQPTIHRMTIKGPLFATQDLAPRGPRGLDHLMRSIEEILAKIPDKPKIQEPISQEPKTQEPKSQPQPKKELDWPSL